MPQTPRKREYIEQLARSLSRRARSAPVDLALFASYRRVRLIHLKDIIPDGLTRPIDGGFEIYLRDQRDVTVDLAESPLPKLTYRQRFTLAHELGHTFYYDIGPATPQLLQVLPRRDLLEQYCDTAAGILLLPERLFVAELARNAVTLDIVLRLSRTFAASGAAVLRRLKSLHSASSEDSALLYARMADHVVEVAFVPPRVLPLLPYPTPYKTRADLWCQSVVTSDFWIGGDRTVSGRIRDSEITVRRFSNPRHGSYYLEVTPLD